MSPDFLQPAPAKRDRRRGDRRAANAAPPGRGLHPFVPPLVRRGRLSIAAFALKSSCALNSEWCRAFTHLSSPGLSSHVGSTRLVLWACPTSDVISLGWAPCLPKRDGRDVGERSDAVLRTAMPGHDDLKDWKSPTLSSLRAKYRALPAPA